MPKKKVKMSLVLLADLLTNNGADINSFFLFLVLQIDKLLLYKDTRESNINERSPIQLFLAAEYPPR